MDNKTRIIECLEESGLSVLENGEIEITNSVNYIYAVLSLEEEFEIEFDESYINGDFMHTVDQLEEIINLISKQKKTLKGGDKYEKIN